MQMQNNFLNKKRKNLNLDFNNQIYELINDYYLEREINNDYLENINSNNFICKKCKTKLKNKLKIQIVNNNNLNILNQESKIFYLCLNCFLIFFKFEKKNLNNYSYFIPQNKKKIFLFTNDWNINDEIKLINSISKDGFENWTDISKNLNKPINEIKSHYQTFYNIQKPYLNIDQIALNFKQKKYIENIFIQNKILQNKLLNKLNKTKNKYPESSIQNIQTEDKIIVNQEDIIKNHSHKESGELPYPYNIAGFWLKRKELEIEYLNDFEKEIKDIEFLENEENLNPIFYREKMKILSIYNELCEQRNIIKDFYIDRNIINIVREDDIINSFSKENKNIYQKLQLIRRFFKEEDFKKIFYNSILEYRLKERINKIKEYKQNGLKTYEDVKTFKESNLKKNPKNNRGLNFNEFMEETTGIGEQIFDYLIETSKEIIKQDFNEIEKSFCKNTMKIFMKDYQNFKYIMAKNEKNILNNNNNNNKNLNGNNVLVNGDNIENYENYIDSHVDYIIKYNNNFHEIYDKKNNKIIYYHKINDNENEKKNNNKNNNNENINKIDYNQKKENKKYD